MGLVRNVGTGFIFMAIKVPKNDFWTILKFSIKDGILPLTKGN
jgi:hypothetical protein